MEKDINKLNFWNTVMVVGIIILAYFGNLFNDPQIGQKAIAVGDYLITFVGVLGIVYLISAKGIRINLIDIFLVLTSILCVVVTQRLNLIVIAILLIFMIYFNEVNTKGLLTVYCVAVSVFLVIIMLDYYLLKNHQNTDIVMWRIDHLITRKTLGFSHPNQFMIAWMGLCIAYLLKIKKYYFVGGATILVLNFLFYYLTASRTEFLLVCFSVVAIVGLRKWLEMPLSKFAKFLLAIAPLFLLGISFMMIQFYQNPTLNTYLSGRPTLYKQFYDSNGISLFGSLDLEDAMFDNSYLQLLLSKGLVIGVMYIVIMFRFVKNNYINLRFAILLAVFYVSGITETLLFKFEIFLPFILYIYEINSMNMALSRNLKATLD